jgi:molecular chaperone GrpE
MRDRESVEEMPESVDGRETVEEMQARSDAAAVTDAPDGVDVIAGEPSPQAERDLAAEYLEALQRERASFINYRRRTEQERAEMAQYATSRLLQKLLGVVDDFDRALAAIPEEERQGNKWVEGVELIARKLHTLLDQEGVEPIEALGQPFDPNLHEAVAFEDNAEEGGEHVDTVSEVFAKGYKLHDRVLRPAMVKVQRK